MDLKDPLGDYTPENIQLVTFLYNHAKSWLTDDDVFWMSLGMVAYHDGVQVDQSLLKPPHQRWWQPEYEKITKSVAAYKLYEHASKKTPLEKRRLEFDLKFKDVSRLIENGVCNQTGIEFMLAGIPPRVSSREVVDCPARASLDRIDNSQGYVPDNIQVVLKMYNTAKWVWNDEDVLAMARALINKHGLANVEARLRLRQSAEE